MLSFCPFVVALMLAAVAADVETDGKAGVVRSFSTPISGMAELTCNDPGTWKFDVSASIDEKGREVVAIRMDSPVEADPPPFGVNFRMPGAAVQNVWTVDYSRGYFSVDPKLWWDWKSRYVSGLAQDMPIAVAFNSAERSPIALACSEAVNRLEFGLFADDRTCDMIARCEFFSKPAARRKTYGTKVLLDRRGRFWFDVVRECSDWIVAENAFKPAAVPEAARDPLYSTWYAYLQDVHAAELEKEAGLAAALGMKTMILDDGWQKSKSAGFYSATGDWMPARDRFPDMKRHVEAVHAAGLRYMLWLAVPFMGEEAKNYSRFKDKVLYDQGEGTWILDPRFPEVREYLVQTYERVIRDWGFDGVKLDFIDAFAEPKDDPGRRENYSGRDCRSVPEAVDRLMRDVLARLRNIRPDVLVEFRQHYMGPAVRQYGNMIRAADCPADMCANRRRVCDLRLTSGTTAVHSDMLVWSRGESPEGAALPILNVLFSTIQYSMVLDALGASHKDVIRAWLDFSQKHRDALLKGAFRPHHPENGYSWVEAENADERIVAIYAPDVCASLGRDDRRVYLVNATLADSVLIEMPAAARTIAMFDVFGRPAGTASAGPGVTRLRIPRSGYAKIEW